MCVGDNIIFNKNDIELCRFGLEVLRQGYGGISKGVVVRIMVSNDGVLEQDGGIGGRFIFCFGFKGIELVKMRFMLKFRISDSLICMVCLLGVGVRR